MDKLEIMAVTFHLLFWTFIILALIYLIIRRVKIRDEEDFEKRDN